MSVETKEKVSLSDYRVPNPNDWCHGCGDFGILRALQQALAALGLMPHEVTVFGGIGCSGKTPYYLGTYGIHTLHGRVLPFATGAKLANPELTVVAVGGDGDGLAIGAGHFVNSGRRNVDMTYILFNNEVYGLTKGQASPTLPMGLQTKALPEPTIQGQVNPLMVAMASGFTWIGRGYAFDIRQLADLIQKAIKHPGLSFLEVAQPCPAYNDLHHQDWFAGKDRDGDPRVYDVNENGYDPVLPDNSDQAALVAKMGLFLEKAHEWGDKIPTGVLLENRSASTYEERIAGRLGYAAAAPAKRAIADGDGKPTTDLSEMFANLRVS